MDLYTHILRPLFFRLDAESAHNLAIALLARTPPALIRAFFGGQDADSRPRDVFGIRFPNPVGLAAGMDKNAGCLPAWAALGFGFAEIGTITAHAQPGNPRPRAFRYPAERALINRMGFNNEGARVVAARLARLKNSGRWPAIPIGINIGKSKVTPLDEAPADYLASMEALAPFGDYFAINVSSPNTPGLRELQETEKLRAIARAVRSAAGGKPVLIKIAPDLADADAIAIASMAAEEGLAGLIATNTTLDHSSVARFGDEQGGLSGAPLLPRSTALLHALHRSTTLPIIASGGVMDVTSAREKFAAGASLVQIYTGFIYSGPGLIRVIKRS